MDGQPDSNNQYYVIAAIVAAELNHTLSYCKRINLIASNAQAASTRAGNSAKGFKVLTGFIDELAAYTVKTAMQINQLAQVASRLATKTLRAQTAKGHFAKANKLGQHAQYFAGIHGVLAQISEDYHNKNVAFYQQIKSIEKQLFELKNNLRSATALASICRIEACKVDEDNRDTFNDVANHVDEVALLILNRVDNAISLFDKTRLELPLAS